jgi:hypothetical protein
MRYLSAPITALLLLASATGAHGQETKKTVDFQRDIQPILAENCYSCHSEVKIKGGLRVDSLAAVLKGGSSGRIIVNPGKSKDSLIVKKADPDDPTPHKGNVLSAQELAMLKAWIDNGARPSAAAAPAKKSTIVDVDLDKLPPDLAKQIRDELAKKQPDKPDKKP